MHRAKRSITVTKSPTRDKVFNIIIPAAGIGSRMVSYGVKSLIKIHNETIIERQLRLIKHVFNKYQIILVTGFQSSKLMNATPDNIIKIENENYKDSNVLRSIGMGLRACTSNNVIILYGDLIFNTETITAPFDRDSMAIVSNTMSDNEIGCVSHNKNIENFCYDLPNKWAQIVYLTGNELELMKKISWNKNKSNMYGFEALNWIIDNGGTIKEFMPNKSKIIDIDSSKDIIKAKEIL